MEVEALCREAAALHRRGALPQAEQLYRQIVEAAPRHYLSRYLLGVLCFQQGRAQEALEHVAAALRIDPAAAEAHNIQGLILQALAHHDEALASFERALALRPDFDEAWSNRGASLQHLGRAAEALESLERALALAPGRAESRFNQGVVLHALGRPEAALESFARGLAIDPRRAGAWTNHGLVLHALGRFDEARQSWDRAIAIDPLHADAHWNKALCALLQERFEEGWPLYEWRKRRAQWNGVRAHAVPAWQGEDIAGKTLLVHAEQGLGDTIQFCRYGALAAVRGARVILSVQDALVPLLRQMPAPVQVVGKAGEKQACDFHIALLSMPLAFGTRRQTIPAAVPYLRADPQRARAWRERIGGQGFRIGICWQGLKSRTDMGRSFPLACLAPVAAIPGVRLISLQKNDGIEQLDHLPPGMTVETLARLDEGPGAFLDTAAVMQHLDLVIASDTAVVHLAGALGRPAWVALQHVPDWRWGLERSDTPWYPSLELFRQGSRGDWAGVFAAMAGRLRRQTAMR
jgi:tetratricopeptide (TPR) repeat protein